MSEKVKLPREVARALNYARNRLGWTDGNILVRTIRGDWESAEMQPLNEFVQSDDDRILIAAALVNGYEVEETHVVEICHIPYKLMRR
ncbi:DUF1642 domain-containing protein [Paenibacillus alkaliterrae]|uniref:DUF1642 domain-containing protein n=1 Tax=Paenibacillus alkaliterrae TaxID=320909 RepID=UPI001F41A758|nr:DUF1642 domain-containing protein [Paenibacillus alkaliterrae]MCF2938942.1 DUF1642 domain-containing protein [Paenibacillus alkaliterrae]